jgi:hypothetical protein
MKSNFAFAYLIACLFGLFPNTSVAQTGVVLTRGNIQSTSPEDFGRVGWPNGNAPPIVKRRVTMEGTMWPPLTPPNVELYQAPIPEGQFLCRRISYSLPLEWRDTERFHSELNSGQPASLNDNSQLVLLAAPRQIVGLSIAPNCRVSEEQQFAPVSASYTPQALIGLTLLESARRRARRDVPPDFFIQCATRSGPNRCAATPQNSLAQLPIHLVWNVAQGYTTNSYEFWISKPNQLVWEVTIVFSEDKRIAGVLMTSLIPHPF